MLDRDVLEMVERAAGKLIPIEPCIGQLEIPWDLEDHNKVYRSWSRPANNHFVQGYLAPQSTRTITKGLRLVTDVQASER